MNLQDDFSEGCGDLGRERQRAVPRMALPVNKNALSLLLPVDAFTPVWQ
jgi:hypothetical protein